MQTAVSIIDGVLLKNGMYFLTNEEYIEIITAAANSMAHSQSKRDEYNREERQNQIDYLSFNSFCEKENKKEEYGTVYIIKNEPLNQYKVGRTKNMTRRMVSFTLVNPNMKLITQFDNIRGYAELERKIHIALSDFKIRNEWFEISDEEWLLNHVSSVIIGHNG